MGQQAAGRLVSATSLHTGGSPEDAEEEEEEPDVDIYASATRTGVLREIHLPSWREDSPKNQAPRKLKNAMTEDLDSLQMPIVPSTVLLHVYDLDDDVKVANKLLAFAVDEVTLGGAFHAGVEVYGNEWTYGRAGVSNEAPRATDGHVYRCSVFMGRTTKSEDQVADVLHEMCHTWHGADYDLLAKNCCSFSAEFCNRLGVGPLPPWVDRFARILNTGRKAGRGFFEFGQEVSSLLSRGIRELLSGEFGEFGEPSPKVQQRRPDGDTPLGTALGLAQPPSASQGLGGALLPRLGGGLRIDLPEEGDGQDELARSTPSRPKGVYFDPNRSKKNLHGLAELMCRAHPQLHIFPPGSYVEYNSATHGWIPARVRSYDQNTGLHELDCKAGVDAGRLRWPQSAPGDAARQGEDSSMAWPAHQQQVSSAGYPRPTPPQPPPPQPVPPPMAAFASSDLGISGSPAPGSRGFHCAFPVGAAVEYRSVTQGIWVKAKVVAFHAASGLYDLDIKSSAEPARIRWPGEASNAGDGGNPAAQAQEAFDDLRGISASPVDASPEGKVSASRAASAVDERRPDVVRGTSPPGGGGDGDCPPVASERQLRGTSQALPAQPQHAVGAAVEYYSVTHGTWLPAKVLGFHSSSGLFDLDCRQLADPERIRAAPAVSEDAAKGVSVPAAPAPDDSAGAGPRAPGSGIAEGAGVFPPGTVVEYHATTRDVWVRAVVLGYLPAVDRYDLDIRGMAEPSRLRLAQQHLDPVPSGSIVGPAGPAESGFAAPAPGTGPLPGALGTGLLNSEAGLAAGGHNGFRPAAGTAVTVPARKTGAALFGLELPALSEEVEPPQGLSPVALSSLPETDGASQQHGVPAATVSQSPCAERAAAAPPAMLVHQPPPAPLRKATSPALPVASTSAVAAPAAHAASIASAAGAVEALTPRSVADEGDVGMAPMPALDQVHDALAEGPAAAPTGAPAAGDAIGPMPVEHPATDSEEAPQSRVPAEAPTQEEPACEAPAVADSQSRPAAPVACEQSVLAQSLASDAAASDSGRIAGAGLTAEFSMAGAAPLPGAPRAATDAAVAAGTGPPLQDTKRVEPPRAAPMKSAASLTSESGSSSPAASEGEERIAGEQESAAASGGIQVVRNDDGGESGSSSSRSSDDDKADGIRGNSGPRGPVTGRSQSRSQGRARNRSGSVSAKDAGIRAGSATSNGGDPRAAPSLRPPVQIDFESSDD